MSFNGSGNSSYRPGNNQRYPPQRDNYRQYNSGSPNNSNSNNGSGYAPGNRYNNSNSYIPGKKFNSYDKDQGSAYRPQQQHRPVSRDRPNFQPRYQSNRNHYQNFYNQAGSYRSDNPIPAHQIWMGDLDPQWDEAAISKIWTSLGQTPSNVKIMRDRNPDASRFGSKPAYSFVTFENQDAVKEAVAKNGLQVPGSNKVLKLNFASSGTSSSSTPPPSTSQYSSYVPGGASRASPSTSGAPAASSSRSLNEISLFVGDLSPDVTDSMLFEKFNMMYPSQIKQVKVMFNPATRLSKGFGFVRFHTEEAQQRALNEANGIEVGGRPIRVAPAAPTSGSSTATGSNSVASAPNPSFSRATSVVSFPQTQPTLTQFTDPRNTTICIKGLSSSISEADIFSHFCTFGHIIYCRVLPHLNRAYVNFYSREAAETAMLFMNGFMINDSRLVLTWGKSKRSTGNFNAVKYEPDVSQGYTRAPKPPKLYGTVGPYIAFDKLSKSEAEKLPSQFEDNSKPLTANQIDTLYLRTKTNRDELLSSAAY